jgi:hypothetical protein
MPFKYLVFNENLIIFSRKNEFILIGKSQIFWFLARFSSEFCLNPPHKIDYPRGYSILRAGIDFDYPRGRIWESGEIFYSPRGRIWMNWIAPKDFLNAFSNFPKFSKDFLWKYSVKSCLEIQSKKKFIQRWSYCFIKATSCATRAVIDNMPIPLVHMSEKIFEKGEMTFEFFQITHIQWQHRQARSTSPSQCPIS